MSRGAPKALRLFRFRARLSVGCTPFILRTTYLRLEGNNLAPMILLGNIFGIAFAQAYFIRARLESDGSTASYSTVMSVVSIVGCITRILRSALLLAAVFVGRKSRTIPA